FLKPKDWLRLEQFRNQMSKFFYFEEVEHSTTMDYIFFAKTGYTSLEIKRIVGNGSSTRHETLWKGEDVNWDWLPPSIDVTALPENPKRPDGTGRGYRLNRLARWKTVVLKPCRKENVRVILPIQMLTPNQKKRKENQ
ncbi:MAG: hypothetical protein ACRDBG_23460, partial [Waterburya sp.]